MGFPLRVVQKFIQCRGYDALVQSVRVHSLHALLRASESQTEGGLEYWRRPGSEVVPRC